MKYRVKIITGQLESVICEVVSENWANTFAEEVKGWIKDNGGNGVTKVVVEEI